MTLRNAVKSDVVEFFSRHLVGLCVAYRLRQEADQPPRFTICSGTLIAIEGTVFFLTAGHVLDQLDKLRLSDQVEIVSAALADTYGWKRTSNIPIPFDLKTARMFYIDNDEAGLDFGVIPLERHFVRLLAKNGNVALSEENWSLQHTVKFDAFAMLGFPEELVSERLNELGAGTAEPVMFSVQRLQRPPDDRAPTRHSQFVGQLSPSLSLASMKGMSGGPIFGIRLKPVMTYWIVALQSSWNAEKRIVYGCEIPVLASLMTRWARSESVV